MAKKEFKEVSFDTRLRDQVDLVDFEPEPTEVEAMDQLGFNKQPLFKVNVRELAIAVKGVQEFYVATTSGGAVTTKLTFTDGILTTVT